MIKNLLLALGVASTTPLNTQELNYLAQESEIIQVQQLTATTQPTQYEQSYSFRVDEGKRKVYQVVDFNTINYGTNIKQYTRALRVSTINNTDGEYYTNYKIATIIESQNIESTISIVKEIVDGSWGSVQPQLVDTARYLQQERTTDSQILKNFVKGQNYTANYLQQIANLMNTDNIVIDYSPNLLTTTENIETYEFEAEIYNFYFMFTNVQLELIDDPHSEATIGLNYRLVNQLTFTIEYEGIVNPQTYEVVDIGGLMFEVLGMPFAWLSIAFNFTLFEGTPYAINISTIILSLLVALIGVIVVKIIIKVA